MSSLARLCVLTLAVCVLAGAGPPPPKPRKVEKPIQITLENLGTLEGGKLLPGLLGYYIRRDYKGVKEKEAALDALAYLAPVDELPGKLKYAFADDRPRFVFDARPRESNPAAEKALRDLVEHSFTATAKDGYQNGPDAPRYTIDVDLVAPLAGSVVVVWGERAVPKGDLAARVKELEDKLKKAEDDIAALNAEIAELAAKMKKNGGRPGCWAVAYVWAVDCCGCWYPVAYWYYVPAEPKGKPGQASRGGRAPDSRDITLTSLSEKKPDSPLPAPLDTAGWKKGDASRLFWRGYTDYFDADHAAAWQSFEAATRLSPDDARFWYYRALAERALGEHNAAEASRLAGLKAEKKSEARADLAQALERVQGARRAWLRLGK